MDLWTAAWHLFLGSPQLRIVNRSTLILRMPLECHTLRAIRAYSAQKSRPKQLLAASRDLEYYHLENPKHLN